LTVNLNNLVEKSEDSSQQKNITNQGSQGPESDQQPRGSRKSQRRSNRPTDIDSNDQFSNTLFDFFKSLDYQPKVVGTTVRASYKSGRESYNLYGYPATKPGEKGQVYIQSQEGFNKDLPPVRLSEDQRDKLIQNF